LVQRHEGQIGLFVGDGVTAYFGYPRAHEDSDQSAVQACLDIMAGLTTLRRAGLEARCGLHTGLLAVESNNVIDIRLRSIATGKVDAKAETRLMISEKVDAAFEAGSMLANGRRPADVIDFYRMHVAANAARLS